MPTLALLGDVMLGRGVDLALRELSPDQPWGDLLPELGRADLRLANLECALTQSDQPWARTPKVFHFRADPSAVAVLRAARIDAVSLANNHVLDFEEAGLAETLATLDAAGIAHAGAGRTRADAFAPVVLPFGTHRLGLVAITDNEPGWAATDTRPGVAYVPTRLDAAPLELVERAIADARRAGADWVVLSNHWGPNMVERPPDQFRRFAHALVDRGVDVFFGHSAHLAQGVEAWRGRPVLYDTGDVIDDYAVDPELRNDRSCLFLVHFDDAGPRELEVVPLRLFYARVERATGDEARTILRRMERLSRELGTSLHPAEGVRHPPGRFGRSPRDVLPLRGSP